MTNKKYKNIRHKCYSKRNNNIRKYLEFDNYQEYLASDLWQSIRQRVFEQKGKFCNYCKSTNRLQIHHLSYSANVLAGKNIVPLIVVCNECHFKISKIEKEFNINPDMSTWTYKQMIGIEPRVKNKKVHSLKIVSRSGLPETLHHSLMACLNNWKIKSITEFIKKYENRRKADEFIYNLYLENKDLVIKFLVKEIDFLTQRENW